MSEKILKSHREIGQRGTRVFHRADVLIGRCEHVPASVEAVEFHGVKNTKHDALIKEVVQLYNVTRLSELIYDCGLAAKHMRVGEYNLF